MIKHSSVFNVVCNKKIKLILLTVNSKPIAYLGFGTFNLQFLYNLTFIICQMRKLRWKNEKFGAVFLEHWKEPGSYTSYTEHQDTTFELSNIRPWWFRFLMNGQICYFNKASHFPKGGRWKIVKKKAVSVLLYIPKS